MTDLTSAFQSAARGGRRPSRVEITSALHGLSMAVGGTVDWEVGEEWGRVLRGDCVIAFVCTRVPLALAKRSVPTHALLGFDVVVVDSFDDQEYRVDRQVLEKLFGRPLSRNIDWDGLSIEELWWATVT